MKDVLFVLSGGLSFLAFLPYIFSIIQRRSQPIQVTWLVWALFDSLVLAGMIAETAFNTQILAFASASWVVFLLSIKYGRPGWTRLDKVCLLISVLGIVGWYWFDNPKIAITAGLMAGVTAATPTIRSASLNPMNEDKWAWATWFTSSVMLLAAIPVWTYAATAQIFAYGAVQVIVVLLTWRRQPIGYASE